MFPVKAGLHELIGRTLWLYGERKFDILFFILHILFFSNKHILYLQRMQSDKLETHERSLIKKTKVNEFCINSLI